MEGTSSLSTPSSSSPPPSLDIAKTNPSSSPSQPPQQQRKFIREFSDEFEEEEEEENERMDEEYATAFHWKEGGNNVYLVGSFTKWLENKVKMKKDENAKSVWSAIVFLKVGIYSYKFIVDGEWRYANDQTKITDEHGNINNCLSVTFPRRRLREAIPRTWSPSTTIRRTTKPECEILHNQMLLNGVEEIPRRSNRRRYTSENFYAESSSSDSEEEEQSNNNNNNNNSNNNNSNGGASSQYTATSSNSASTTSTPSSSSSSSSSHSSSSSSSSHTSSSSSSMGGGGGRNILVRSTSSDFGPISNNDYTSNCATSQHRLMLIMVGLPARGKSCIAQKLDRYLNWMGYRSKVFNLGNYRRSQLGSFHSHDFFRPDNVEGIKQREELAKIAMADVITWFTHDNGTVAIYDGTNSTRERRQKLLHLIEEHQSRFHLVVKAIFVEIICTDPNVIEENIRSTKVNSLDYAGVPPDQVVKDFTERIRHYAQAYETITNHDDFRYIKIFDAGRQMVTNRITGFLPSRVMFFLSNLHITARPIFLVRHGQSKYNLKKLLGGDSKLTPLGLQFADALKEFVCDEISDPEHDLCIWSSTMIRTIQTANDIPCVQYVRWKALEEINVGVCDGMSYKEIEQKMPDEFSARSKDKLRYRYPRGESYEDLIRRIEPVIIELERQRKPVLIVAHRAVLRCFYAYFTNLDREKVPHISVPLHCVIKLSPHAYGTTESRFQLMDPIEEE